VEIRLGDEFGVRFQLPTLIPTRKTVSYKTQRDGADELPGYYFSSDTCHTDEQLRFSTDTCPWPAAARAAPPRAAVPVLVIDV
jgi:hypothetical protein